MSNKIRTHATSGFNTGKSQVVLDLAKKNNWPVKVLKMSKHETFEEMLKHSKE